MFVPRILGFVLVSLAVGGVSAPAFAGGILPGNGGGPINLTPIPSPTTENALTSSSGYSGGDTLEQRFGVRGGALDFFSPAVDRER